MPHDAHATLSISGVAHFAQNRAPSRFGWPQDGQSVVALATSRW
jgi:hypothetical protein